MTHKTFIEKRKLSLLEYIMVMLLEDYASHGLCHNSDYSIDDIFLGKKGIFRVLCKGDEKILVGRRYPPRIRHQKNQEEYEYYYFIFYQ